MTEFKAAAYFLSCILVWIASGLGMVIGIASLFSGNLIGLLLFPLGFTGGVFALGMFYKGMKGM